MSTLSNLRTPEISIITPAYNVEGCIDNAVRSVLAQDFTDWEMLIVDDCSQDRTLTKVQRWTKRDARIHLIANNINEGPGPTRNKAIAQAAGRYIAFLDADDEWHSNKLARQLNFMRATGAYFSYTAYEIVDDAKPTLMRVVPAPERICYFSLLKNTNIGCLTVMIDTKKVTDLSMPDIPTRQPLVLWLRLLREFGPAYGLNEILARYHARAGSISSNKFTAAMGVWHVYRQYERLPLIPALWYFMNYATRGFMRNRGIR